MSYLSICMNSLVYRALEIILNISLSRVTTFALGNRRKFDAWYEIKYNPKKGVL